MKHVVVTIFVILGIFGCNGNEDATDTLSSTLASDKNIEAGSGENEKPKSAYPRPTVNSDGEFVTGLVAGSRHVHDNYLRWGATVKLYVRIIDDEFTGSIAANIDFANIELTTSEPEVVLLESNRYYVLAKPPKVLEKPDARGCR